MTEADARALRILDAAFQLFYRHGYPKVSMSDIASAVQVSRPTLYASFVNKEAIFSGLVERARDANLAAEATRVDRNQPLAAQLATLFDIWVIEPVASVIDSENGSDLLAHCADYAPAATADLYAHFEKSLRTVLQRFESGDAKLPSCDIAYILRIATTGIKSGTESLPTLKRIVAGLIRMADATVRA